MIHLSPRYIFVFQTFDRTKNKKSNLKTQRAIFSCFINWAITIIIISRLIVSLTHLRVHRKVEIYCSSAQSHHDLQPRINCSRVESTVSTGAERCNLHHDRTDCRAVVQKLLLGFGDLSVEFGWDLKHLLFLQIKSFNGGKKISGGASGRTDMHSKDLRNRVHEYHLENIWYK